MESSYDAWRTATPYEDDICRAEFEDDNLSVDTSFIEEEDEEIKSLISSESNKGGEDMDKFECLLGGKKCTNCGRHETSMAICATEDSVGNKFLGWIPSEKKAEPLGETRTGVTIKKPSFEEWLKMKGWDE